VVGVGEMLGDNALQVSLNHGPVQRPPFADDRARLNHATPMLGDMRANGVRSLAVHCELCPL
jgi:hypothetical protein